MVQYKIMELAVDAPERLAIYRPDKRFGDALARMQKFRGDEPDSWKVADGLLSYRLCGDGFYFKLCTRVQLEVMSTNLLPGMYLPREFVEAGLADGSLKGEHGGFSITIDNTKRHISNTLFAELVRDGWIGTRGLSSIRVAEIVREGLVQGHAMVIARSRPPRIQPDPEATLADLGL
jgi:hypothetical protein